MFGRYILASTIVRFQRYTFRVQNDQRREMLFDIHSSHKGFAAYPARERSTLFWTGISAAINDRVGPCEACPTYDSNQQKAPMAA